MDTADLPILALTFVGLLLVAIGLLVAGNLEVVVIGVVCLVAAGLFGVLTARRPRS